MPVITLTTNVNLDNDCKTPMQSFLVSSCSNEEAEPENQILCLIHTALKVVKLGSQPSQGFCLEFSHTLTHYAVFYAIIENSNVKITCQKFYKF